MDYGAWRKWSQGAFRGTWPFGSWPHTWGSYWESAPTFMQPSVDTAAPLTPQLTCTPFCTPDCRTVPSSYLHALWAGQRPLGPRHESLWGLIAGTPWPITLLTDVQKSRPGWTSSVAAGAPGTERGQQVWLAPGTQQPPTSQTQTRSALFFLDPLFLPGCHSSLLCCLS